MCARTGGPAVFPTAGPPPLLACASHAMRRARRRTLCVMPMLTEVPDTHLLAPNWRAAVVILTAAFPHDQTVWDRIGLGEHADLTLLYCNTERPMSDRVLLACAQGFIDGHTPVPIAQLWKLSDPRLRLVLDALAIARGSLPID